jgi:hypothetical protein
MDVTLFSAGKRLITRVPQIADHELYIHKVSYKRTTFIKETSLLSSEDRIQDS